MFLTIIAIVFIAYVAIMIPALNWEIKNGENYENERYMKRINQTNN